MLTNDLGHPGCKHLHPCPFRNQGQHYHPNQAEVVAMSAQLRYCVHFAGIRGQATR